MQKPKRKPMKPWRGWCFVEADGTPGPALKQRLPMHRSDREVARRLARVEVREVLPKRRALSGSRVRMPMHVSPPEAPEEGPMKPLEEIAQDISDRHATICTAAGQSRSIKCLERDILAALRGVAWACQDIVQAMKPEPASEYTGYLVVNRDQVIAAIGRLAGEGA